jgi:hypothetical protein
MPINTAIANGSPAAEHSAPDTLELLLHDNRISLLQREILERPENHRRPVRIRQAKEKHARHSYDAED